MPTVTLDGDKKNPPRDEGLAGEVDKNGDNCILAHRDTNKAQRGEEELLKSLYINSDSYNLAIESSSLSSLCSVSQCNHQHLIHTIRPYSCTIAQARKHPFTIYLLPPTIRTNLQHVIIHAFPHLPVQPPSQCKPPNARIRTVVPTQSIRNAKQGVKLR